MKKCKKYTKAENRSLIRQIVKEKKKLPDLYLPGRTPAAINTQRGRLRAKGLLGDSCPLRKIKTFSIREFNFLKRYASMGLSAIKTAKLGVLPGRSKNSISGAMNRNDLGDPLVSELAKLVKHLDEDQKNRLKDCLLNHSAGRSTKSIAEEFELPVKLVRAYRRKLGRALTWQEARNTPDYLETKERMRKKNSGRMKSVWANKRAARRKEFETTAAKLKMGGTSQTPRPCNKCGGPWYATRFFYHTMVKKTENGQPVKKLLYKTCRLCRSAERREKS
jgi:hypothetical protein